MLQAGELTWRDAPANSLDDDSVLRPARKPFSADGGLRVLQGNLGRAVIKVSPSSPNRVIVRRPWSSTARSRSRSLQGGELARDVIAVVRFQGPRANGMPELHKLTPPLANAAGPGASRWRWSPMDACPAHPARCPRPFT
jgi:phosphogluconate dehydratase